MLLFTFLWITVLNQEGNHKIIKYMERFIFLTLALVIGKLCMAQQETKLNLYFESDKYSLTTQHQQEIDVFFKSLNGEIKGIIISGHTDWVAGADYNLRLSKKRATAVSRYITKNYAKDIVQALSYLGENTPAADNTSEKGRAKNRRVEVTIDIDVPVAINTNSCLIEEEPGCKERDTLFRSPGGVEIYIPGCCLPNGLTVSDISINVTEAISPSQWLTTGTTTRDANGNCLISGGMVYLSILNKKTGKPIEQLCSDKGFTVRIPAPNPDPDMKFYVTKDGSPKWDLAAEGEMKIEQKDGKSYYAFSGMGNIGGSMGFNPDKLKSIPVAGEALAKSLSFLMETKEKVASTIYKNWEPPYVKTKALKKSRAYITGDSSSLDANYIKKTIFTIDDCGCIPPERQVVTVIGKHKNIWGREKYYVYHDYRSNLKVRRAFLSRRTRYVVRRRDYIKVDNYTLVKEVIGGKPGEGKERVARALK